MERSLKLHDWQALAGEWLDRAAEYRQMGRAHRSGADTMKPKAAAHDGRCSEGGGQDTVITIEADPLPVSLCPSCLARIIAGATGIRSAIVAQWRRWTRKTAERDARRSAELQEKAQEDVERVLKMKGRGNGRGA